jgi:hypothetical protein
MKEAESLIDSHIYIELCYGVSRNAMNAVLRTQISNFKLDMTDRTVQSNLHMKMY